PERMAGLDVERGEFDVAGAQSAVDEQQPHALVAIDPGQRVRNLPRGRRLSQRRKRGEIAPAPAFRAVRGKVEGHQARPNLNGSFRSFRFPGAKKVTD